MFDLRGILEGRAPAAYPNGVCVCVPSSLWAPEISIVFHRTANVARLNLNYNLDFEIRLQQLAKTPLSMSDALRGSLRTWSHAPKRKLP